MVVNPWKIPKLDPQYLLILNNVNSLLAVGQIYYEVRDLIRGIPQKNSIEVRNSADRVLQSV